MYTGNHPFKNYREQFDILTKEKHLEIKNPTFAINILQHYSYYTIINGYKDLFIDNSYKDERFKKGTTFEMLYQTHWIDIQLSSVLFKYSLLVEKKIKTRISYHIAKKFGELEHVYLNKDNYSQSRHHRGKINKLIESIDKNRNLDISAIHYKETENNLPPWIAAKAISFGDIFVWYSVLKLEDKLEIIKNFIYPLPTMTDDELTDVFNKLIGQVYKYRNLSAHGNRNIKLIIDEKYKYTFQQLQKMGIKEYFTENNRNSIFSVIVTIFILLDDNYAIENFYKELTIFVSNYSKEEFKFIDKTIFDLYDFPINFLEIINNIKNNKQYREKFYY